MRDKFLVGLGAVVVCSLIATNPLVADAAKQITGGQIKNNSLTSKDIKNNSLKGADIKEGTLGTVPSAANAGNGAVRVDYRSAANNTVRTIFSAGGLVIKAQCLTGPDLVLTMESTVDNAAVFAETHDHDGNGNGDGDNNDTYQQQGDFDAAQPVVLDGSALHSDDGQGLEINYSSPNGTEVFVKLQNWLGSGVASAPAACFVGGVGFIA